MPAADFEAIRPDPAEGVVGSGRHQAWRRVRGFLIRAVVGAALIAFLLWHYDRRAIVQVLGRERFEYFLAAVALYLVGQVISAWRWQLLARMLAVRAPYLEFLVLCLVGMFTNLFVPGLVGGDAARAFYLGRRHRSLARAAASVIADRGFGLLALVWFAAASAALLGREELPTAFLAPMIIVGAVGLLGYLLMPLAGRLVSLMPAGLKKYAEVLVPYFEQPLALIPALALSVLLQASLVVGQYVLARGLGLEIPFGVFLLVVPSSNFFASFPVTLNGLGLREGAYILLFGFAGVSKVTAIALGLLWFASTMTAGLIGGLSFFATDIVSLHPTAFDEPQPRPEAAALPDSDPDRG